MKHILIGSGVAICVVVLLVFIYTQIKATAETASKISDDVINRYVTLLQEEDYAGAWETCLAAGYQKETSLEEFTQAHADRVKEFGALQGYDERDIQHEANLFSSEVLYGINGTLHYENRDVFVTYKVDANVEPYRIVETLGGSDRSDLLASGIW